eukprot:g41031.t1
MSGGVFWLFCCWYSNSKRCREFEVRIMQDYTTITNVMKYGYMTTSACVALLVVGGSLALIAKENAKEQAQREAGGHGH